MDSLFLSSHHLPTVLQLEVRTKDSLPVHAGMCLTWSCTGNHGCYELLSAKTSSCPEDSISQLSSPPSASDILSEKFLLKNQHEFIFTLPSYLQNEDKLTIPYTEPWSGDKVVLRDETLANCTVPSPG